MSLPTSRNRTYSAASPVRSADLNDIQDCIVGFKHPALELAFAGCAFVLQTGTVNRLSNRIEFTAAATLDAPLIIPVGTRIKTVSWSYNRGGAGTMYFTVRRVARSGGPLVTVDTFSDGAGTGYVTPSTRVVNHTVLTGYQYHLEVEGTATANIFEDCVVTIDRL